MSYDNSSPEVRERKEILKYSRPDSPAYNELMGRLREDAREAEIYEELALLRKMCMDDLEDQDRELVVTEKGVYDPKEKLFSRIQKISELALKLKKVQLEESKTFTRVQFLALVEGILEAVELGIHGVVTDARERDRIMGAVRDGIRERLKRTNRDIRG